MGVLEDGKFSGLEFEQNNGIMAGFYFPMRASPLKGFPSCFTNAF
jgi:hypothetical protein